MIFCTFFISRSRLAVHSFLYSFWSMSSMVTFSTEIVVFLTTYGIIDNFIGFCEHMVRGKDVINEIIDLRLTLTRPLRRKLRMRWFFDVSKVKESSFFKSDFTDPPQIFDAHPLENTNLSPSSFHLSVSFYTKICFESEGF